MERLMKWLLWHICFEMNFNDSSEHSLFSATIEMVLNLIVTRWTEYVANMKANLTNQQHITTTLIRCCILVGWLGLALS